MQNFTTFVSFEAHTPIVLKDTGPYAAAIDTDINDLAHPDKEHDGVLMFKLTLRDLCT
jgi:hypothetical protein